MSSIIKITSELEDEDYLINKLIKISEYALINNATLEYYCKSGVWSIVAASCFVLREIKCPPWLKIVLMYDSEFKKCIDII